MIVQVVNYTNKKIVLLESSNRLGGRVESVSTDEYRYEVGAGRFSNKHKLLVELKNLCTLNCKEMKQLEKAIQNYESN